VKGRPQWVSQLKPALAIWRPHLCVALMSAALCSGTNLSQRENANDEREKELQIRLERNVP